MPSIPGELLDLVMTYDEVVILSCVRCNPNLMFLKVAFVGHRLQLFPEPLIGFHEWSYSAIILFITQLPVEMFFI